MTRARNESPVSLDKLDDHLKALLRLKIREFVHLSPWFKNLPTVDPIAPSPATRPVSIAPLHGKAAGCPHRKHDGKIGRRIVRGSLHLTGVIK